MITHQVYVKLFIQNHYETFRFFVTPLGTHALIYLGLDWLTLHGPLVDWQSQTIQMPNCQHQCRDNEKIDEDYLFDSIEVEDKDKFLLIDIAAIEAQVCTIQINAQQLAIDAQQNKPPKTFE